MYYFYRCRCIGRPTIEIDIQDIEFLRGLRFPFCKIAVILGISRSTLYRRLEEEGLSQDLTYTDISDRDLDSELAAIKSNHPNDGERLLSGHLSRQGIIVPRAQLRASIHRVDPINTAIRRSVTIRRRVYHVEGPNCVWHIDGNHKLIRWRFVVHGGIDGYSRTIVFLECADNNRASTVISAFESAVHTHGLPNRIRSDLGGENVDVWRYMIEQHSSYSAVITGSSTHNERIERLWRDVYRCVGILYHDTFRKLEEEGKLDALNEVDLLCLHFIFLPRINTTLKSFVESWNNHPVSSEHNLTPNQLFIRGAIEQDIDPHFPPPSSSNTSCTADQAQLTSPSDRVTVPRIQFNPCALLQIEMSQVDPLGPSTSFGCDLYCQIVNIVGSHLTGGCSHCT